MTTNYHTPIAVGAAANAATFNTPLGQLDAVLGTLNDTVTNAVTGVYNVLDYGAASGGAAATNTAAIQAAINAASAVYPAGVVFIPAGVYEINAPITIATNGVKLLGEAQFGTNIKLVAAGATIKVDKGGGDITYQVEIGNMYIDGNSTGTTGLSLVNANESYFHDIIIINTLTNGILTKGIYCGINTFDRIFFNGMTNAVQMIDGGSSWYTNCNIYDVSTLFWLNSTTAEISDIHVRDCFFETFDTGFLWDCTTHNIIFNGLNVRDCYFLSTNGGGTYEGRILKTIAANNTYSTVVRGVQMSGCYFSTTATKYICEVAWGAYTGGGINRFFAVLRDNYWHIFTNATAWVKSSVTDTSYEYVRIVFDNAMHSSSSVPVQDGTQRAVVRPATQEGFWPFTADDATPSVKLGNLFKTANANATTITMFDDGYNGQTIRVIIADAVTTVDFSGTNLKGNAGADWSPGSGDWLEATFDGTNWYCSVHDCTA